MGLKTEITRELMESVSSYIPAEQLTEEKVTINSPGHRFHGKTCSVFHTHKDGSKNVQITHSQRKGDVSNLTLTPSQFKPLKEESQLDEFVVPGSVHKDKKGHILDAKTIPDAKKQENKSAPKFAKALHAARVKAKDESESYDESTETIGELINEDGEDATPTGYVGGRLTAKEIESGKKRKAENKANEWAKANSKKVYGNYGRAFDTDEEGEERKDIPKRAKVDPNRRRGRPSKAETNTGGTFDDKALRAVSWLKATALPKGKTRKIDPMARGDKKVDQFDEEVKMPRPEQGGTEVSELQHSRKGTGDPKVSAASKFYQMQTTVTDDDINGLKKSLGDDATNIPQHTLHGVSLVLHKEGFAYNYEIAVNDEVIKEGVGVTESGIIAEATRFMEAVLEEIERLDGQVDRVKDIVKSTINK